MRDGYSAKDDALILKCVEDADTVGHGCWIAATKEKAIRRGGNNCNWFLSQGINRCEIGSERVKSKIKTLQPWMAGVTFIDLETGMCRFPIGDTAPFIYCGSPIIPGESYCPQCHDICSTARAPKKQRVGNYNCVVQK